MLCANAARSVDDYFEYDFVGAPIADHLGKGYNGGLSLRKRSSIMRILGEWDWEETKKEGDRFEDQWFFNRLVSPDHSPIFGNKETHVFGFSADSRNIKRKRRNKVLSRRKKAQLIYQPWRLRGRLR